jgi:Ca-activated chloride channel family protein
VLALDVSGSLAGERFARLQAAARTFLAGLAAHDQAALVTFNHKIELRQAPTPNGALVQEALARAVAKGSTAVFDAVYSCLKRDWGTGRPVIVLFTDGRDTASWVENEDVLQAARESTALLYVVGSETAAGPHQVSPETGYMYLLQRTADITGGAWWSATFDRLESVFASVIEAANARYVLSYEPEGVRRPGRHRIKVSVKRRGVEVRARQEYVVPR